MRYLLYILLCLSFQDAIAAHVEKNACCHYCRISKNRPRSEGIRYHSCSNKRCKMSYCSSCYRKYPHINVTENKCVVCNKNCCCAYYTCIKKHKHCFTYIRNKKRTSNKNPKSLKRRKKLNYHKNNVHKDFTDIDEFSLMIRAQEPINTSQSLRRLIEGVK
jgi:hypothetical protein